MNVSWRAVPVVLFLFVVGWGAWSILDSVEAPDEDAWWHPTAGLTWQYQETGSLDTTVAADVIVADIGLLTSAEVTTLRQAGRRVVCSFEAGVLTTTADSANALVPDEAVGDPVAGADGARWLDIRLTEELEPFLADRLDESLALGCDGVAPRSVDAWQRDTAFEFRGNEQLRFIRFIVDLAHDRNLAYALHDDAEQAERLAADVDLFVSTGCVEGDRCELYSAAIEAAVPVFVAEPGAPEARYCPVADELGIAIIGKDPAFGPERRTC